MKRLRCIVCEEEGYMFSSNKRYPFFSKPLKMKVSFRADLIVEESVLVEIKPAEYVLPVPAKVLLTYLKLTGISVGLLLNFQETVLKNGIKSIVNNYTPASPAFQRET